MIDWKFRVVDHYNISREIVATSTSILDRFMGQCRCDRMTFKLAAMTSLYLAAKVQDRAQLSLLKLAELSRGEFAVFDIVEMENLILQKLSWRVNPVTVPSFIHSFIHLIPVSNPVAARAIYDRAVFFAELCLFDYSYVTKARSTIAAAAVLNALEGIDDIWTSSECEAEFLGRLRSSTCIDLSTEYLDDTREDLWYIYSLSTQYQEDDLQMMPAESTIEIQKQHAAIDSDDQMHISRSPVSVLK